MVQEPLDAPFLNGLFSSGFSRGKCWKCTWQFQYHSSLKSGICPPWPCPRDLETTLACRWERVRLPQRKSDSKVTWPSAKSDSKCDFFPEEKSLSESLLSHFLRKAKSRFWVTLRVTSTIWGFGGRVVTIRFLRRSRTTGWKPSLTSGFFKGGGVNTRRGIPYPVSVLFGSGALTPGPSRSDITSLTCRDDQSLRHDCVTGMVAVQGGHFCLHLSLFSYLLGHPVGIFSRFKDFRTWGYFLLYTSTGRSQHKLKCARPNLACLGPLFFEPKIPPKKKS